MKFTNIYLAQSYVTRAFETTGASLEIILFDFPFYFICTRREASKLMKQGYELAPRS